LVEFEGCGNVPLPTIEAFQAAFPLKDKLWSG
jgi:hypothetical protein